MNVDAPAAGDSGSHMTLGHDSDITNALFAHPHIDDDADVASAQLFDGSQEATCACGTRCPAGDVAGVAIALMQASCDDPLDDDDDDDVSLQPQPLVDEPQEPHALTPSPWAERQPAPPSTFLIALTLWHPCADALSSGIMMKHTLTMMELWSWSLPGMKPMM